METKTNHIPELTPGVCNSWIVTRKDNGKVVGEFYNRAIIERFAPEKVIIETAIQYLYRINQQLKGK